MFDDTTGEFDDDGIDTDKDEIQVSVSDELTRLHDKYGNLKPQVVVDEARDEGSPIHDRFEWDDTKAGEEFRLGQARKLIRVVVTMGPKGKTTPMFVHVTDADEGPMYVKTTIAVESESLFESALGQLSIKLTIAIRSLTDLISVSTGPLPPPLKSVQKSLIAARKALDKVIAPH